MLQEHKYSDVRNRRHSSSVPYIQVSQSDEAETEQPYTSPGYGFHSLGRLNPRRYLPTMLGGYSQQQTQEPQNQLQGGPMNTLGRLNPRRYLPQVLGGYSQEQMQEPQNQLLGGPMNTLGRLNPRRHLPVKLGGYSDTQMMEPQNQLLSGGPMNTLGRLNPRRYLPTMLGGYSAEQMQEPQNQLRGGPLNALGRINPRRHLPTFLGGYSQEQMREEQNRLENWTPTPATHEMQRNPLLDLPEDQWWRLFIDRSKHNEAEQLENPGMIFDNEQSPGYYRSMMEAFQNEIVTKRGQRMNYDDYIEQHQAISKYMPATNRENARALGGIDNHSKFGNSPVTEEDHLERQAALEEMRNTHILGRSLAAPDTRTAYDQVLPDVITSVVSDGGTQMETVYPASDGRYLVNSILEEHYNSLDQLRDSEDVDAEQQRLETIANTVRSLHVGHFFGDANGRHNIFLLLNKFLTEEDFDPVILEDASAFGGKKTKAGLVDDIRDGQGRFRSLLDQ